MSNWKPGSEVARSQLDREQAARIINQAAYIQRLEAKLTKAREALQKIEGMANGKPELALIWFEASIGIKALDEGSEG